MERYSASQDDNIEERQNSRQTDPQVVATKLFRRLFRLCSSRALLEYLWFAKTDENSGPCSIVTVSTRLVVRVQSGRAQFD
jgi:hypothetical protein